MPKLSHDKKWLVRDAAPYLNPQTTLALLAKNPDAAADIVKKLSSACVQRWLLREAEKEQVFQQITGSHLPSHVSFQVFQQELFRKWSICFFRDSKQFRIRHRDNNYVARRHSVGTATFYVASDQTLRAFKFRREQLKWQHTDKDGRQWTICLPTHKFQEHLSSTQVDAMLVFPKRGSPVRRFVDAALYEPNLDRVIASFL
jgi:hypothetical protein